MVVLWRGGLGPQPTGGNPGLTAPMQNHNSSYGGILRSKPNPWCFFLRCPSHRSSSLFLFCLFLVPRGFRCCVTVFWCVVQYVYSVIPPDCHRVKTIFVCGLSSLCGLQLVYRFIPSLSHGTGRVSQRTRYHDPETDAAKQNSAIISFIINTCADVFFYMYFKLLLILLLRVSTDEENQKLSCI